MVNWSIYGDDKLVNTPDLGKGERYGLTDARIERISLYILQDVVPLVRFTAHHHLFSGINQSKARVLADQILTLKK